MKIAVFGGTFDPVHIAHLIIANAVQNELSLDRLFFVPGAIPPHKRFREISSAQHRLNMLNLAIGDDPVFELCDYEIRRGGISYTIETLKYFADKYHLDRENLFLLIGLDNLLDFHNWKQPEEIIKICTLIVADRVVDDQQQPPKFGTDNILYLDLPLLEISSSQIRHRIRQRKSIKYFVPAEIEEYILSNHLYRD